MTIAQGNEGRPGPPRAAGRSGVGEWRRALAAGVFWCAAVLFAGGVALGLGVGGRVAYGLWQDRQGKQADLAEPRRDCAGRFDPQEWGTPRQQFDGCVSDRMERWTWRGEVHPIFFVFVAAPWLLYLSITGLTSFLAWDYRRDRRRRDARVPHARPDGSRETADDRMRPMGDIPMTPVPSGGYAVRTTSTVVG